MWPPLLLSNGVLIHRSYWFTCNCDIINFVFSKTPLPFGIFSRNTRKPFNFFTVEIGNVRWVIVLLKDSIEMKKSRDQEATFRLKFDDSVRRRFIRWFSPMPWSVMVNKALPYQLSSFGPMLFHDCIESQTSLVGNVTSDLIFFSNLILIASHQRTRYHFINVQSTCS